MPRLKKDILAENEHLRAALADILDECAREKKEQADWPRSVGVCQAIAREALTTQASAAFRVFLKSGELVRCHCGAAWPMIRVPDREMERSGRECYQWLDAISRRKMDRCPTCGEPTSLVSTVPL